MRKIKSHGRKYENPLEDVPDIIGLRVIVYFAADLEIVDKILGALFTVTSTDRKLDTAPSDRFGYASNHYVVRLSQERSQLPEWQPYSLLHAEIQVRTVLQHAWAVVSHKLAYKGTTEAPESLHRPLNSLSGLLEVADREFCQIKQGSDCVAESWRRRFKKSEFVGELDLTSLAVYLEVTGAGEQWSERAVNLGYSHAQAWLTRDGSPPKEMERVLLERLRDCGVRSIAELHDVLASQSDGENRLKLVLSRCQYRSFTPYANPHDILLILVVMANGAEKDAISRMGYRPALRNALCETLQLGCFGE